VEVDVGGGGLPRQVLVLVELHATVEDHDAAEDAVFGLVPRDIGFPLGVDVGIEIAVVVEDAGASRRELPKLPFPNGWESCTGTIPEPGRQGV